MRNKNKTIGIVLKVITLIVFIGINFFIIYQSCLDGVESSNWSNAFLNVIIKIFNFFKIEIIESSAEVLSIIVRKFLGHFLLFSIDGVVTMYGVSLFVNIQEKKKSANSILTCLLFGLLIASITEIIQTMVSGRSGNIVDVIIDFSGFVAGSFIIFFVIKAILNNRSKSNQ